MTLASRLGYRGLATACGLAALLYASGGVWGAEGAPGARDRLVALGRELFAREWVINDSRSHGGDGLGPVFNDRSCVACHHQGGAGGGGAGDKNIEIATATGDGLAGPGFFYSFSMNFGDEGFQYRVGAPAAPKAKPLNVGELVKIHPGFRDAPSVVLHRYGPDFDYPTWRDAVPGPHGAIVVRASQRNPTPLFGMGLIDAIPDEAIKAAAKRRIGGPDRIKGRVSRLPDGRVGRFGWKAQTATLREFALSAAANELGLESSDHHQGADPRIPPIAPPGVDLSNEECAALVEYVRALPAPVVLDADGPKEEKALKAGAGLFKSIGCAHCHLPKLGDVDGIYSDLLLHDMSPQLGDTGFYGVFTSRAADEDARGAKARPAADRKREPGASVQEWRTPPLWGLRDSAPYLHDGRAATIEDAIALHGGQGAPSAQRFARLSARDRQLLGAFLLSLAAPAPGGPGRAAALR